MMRVISGLLALLGALFLSACALAEDKTPDYRYRLTVEVETPEGVRTGSSVIEVEQTPVRSGFAPGAGVGVRKRARGEAVAVDLPGGKTLFALLRSDNDVDWAAHVYVYLKPYKKQSVLDAADDVLELEGERVLPRMWPAVANLKERSAYPMLVTFGDLADPTSVARVDPDDLAATFGAGVRLKRITVELTDDPVTTGIEERLGWLPNVRGTLVHLPIDQYPPRGTPLPLHNTLTEMNFKSGD
jgi:hypothetical protein